MLMISNAREPLRKEYLATRTAEKVSSRAAAAYGRQLKIELCFYGGLIPLLVSDPQINPFTFKLPRTAPIEEDLTNSPSIFDAPIDEDNTSLVNIANT